LRATDRRLRPAAPSTPPAPAPGAPYYQDLLEVAISLTSTLELRAILDAIVDGIIRVARCERGFLMLRESDGSFSLFIGRTRDLKPWDESRAREISRTIVGRVVDTLEPFVGTDLEKMDELLSSGSILEHKIRSAVCLPMLYKEKLIGVIYADSGFVLAPFLEADRSVLRAFGAQAALAVENARQHGEIRDRSHRLEEQNLRLSRQLSGQFAMSGIISKNKRMLEVFDTVLKIAPHDISVLIEGESGTGKEVLARAIHEKSPRRGGPFEAQNCAGIPAGLVESILFGHRKGAFTGAEFDKAGVFENANAGTLFLDEIGDMPLETQPKILRALQQREVTRIGEEGRVRKVDVRIIAATNIDLARAVSEGRFRKDLYYRLGVARIQLPPLRERKEDIIPLAEHFLAGYAQEKKLPRPELSRDARALVLAEPWVGNVRELENAMDYGVAFQDENHVIHARDLERFFQSRQRGPAWSRSDGSLHDQLQRFEERVIRESLAEHESNVSSTARALGISRQQLHLKIKKYGIATRPE
jgi:transcriptional regulator with GAF, ATPase, and Fis domain